MPLTPEQIAKIRKKEAETPDALKRNPLNDYTEGWFLVTLNVRGEAPVLGYIVGDPSAPDGSEYAPRCVLTELGKRVEYVWQTVSDFHPMCRCEELIAMPEHIHALLHLLPGNQEPLGSIINGLMISSTYSYWDTLGIPWAEMREEKDTAVLTRNQDKAQRAQWQDCDHTRSYRGPALMVRRYNDVEAVTPEEIETKRLYIRNNPRKRLITRSKPDRFCVVRNQRSGNWTLERALAAVAADPWIGRDEEKCKALQTNVSKRLKRRADNAGELALDYVGNRSLLAAERKVPLVCHRADADLFEKQQAAVMKAAREGAVVVSAFVSPKERAVRHMLMQEQLPFVELMDNGFGNHYKPGGKAFYSTAENRHVQITCWEYEYRNYHAGDGRRAISREMCLAMNELVRVISGLNDDWWK